MRRNRIIKEMLIAVGVAGGVIALGFMALMFAGPELRKPRDPYRVCLLSRTSVFDQSALGQSANMQLMELKGTQQRAINAEKAAIDAIPPGSQHDSAMAQLLRKVQTENAALESVRSRARNLVIQNIAPTIKREAATSQCDVVLDAATVVDVEQARDLTPNLVKSIDRAVPPLPANTLEGWLK